MSVRDNRPSDSPSQRGERPAQLRLLVEGAVGGLSAALRDAPHEFVIGLENTARCRFQFDGLVHRSVVDPPRNGQRLNRMNCRPGARRPPCAPVEHGRNVERLILSRADLVRSPVTHLEGEPSVHVARSKDLRDTVLVVRVEPKL